MPTYEYHCNSCKFNFEIFHGMSEEVCICPQCKQKSIKKLISTGAAIIIKGTKTPTYYRKQNAEQKQEQEHIKREKIKESAPWWRSNDNGKIRKDILKNPRKYIAEGEI